MLLLKLKEGWDSFLSFLLKITSRACLLGSWLKRIFHWYFHHSLNLIKSLFSSVTEVFTLSPTKITKYYQQIIWYQTIIHILDHCYGTLRDSCVDISPCQNVPFKTTLCFLFLKKSPDKFKSLPDYAILF